MLGQALHVGICEKATAAVIDGSPQARDDFEPDTTSLAADDACCRAQSTPPPASLMLHAPCSCNGMWETSKFRWHNE